MADKENKQVPANALLDETVDVEDEDVTVELPSEGAEAETTEVAGEKEQAASETAVEEEARSSGWVSEAEWLDRHGSKKGWKSADDYVDFRRNFLPILSKENKELRAKIAKIEADRDAEKSERAAAQTKFDRENLKLQLRAARDEGDKDREDEIIDKILDLKITEKAAPRPAPGPVPVDPEVQRDFLDFAGRNPWIKTDPRLAKIFAVQLKQVMETMGRDYAVPEALEDAKDMVKRMYPEKFPASRRTAMAEGRGEPGAGNGTTRSWSQLKPDVRSTYDKFIEDNPKVTKADLLKDFAASERPSDYFRS